jgi:hypothetical protein
MRQFVVEVAAGLLLLVMGAYIGARMVRNEYALGCAHTSEGTDQAIADCYTVNGLAVPDGIGG